MRVLLVGATGDVGRAIQAELGERHETITAGRKSGDFRVDLTKPDSVKRLFEKVGRVDTVISSAGVVRFKPLTKHTPASIKFGLDRKVMGQVNLVLIGLPHVADAGSFTLTSGILDRDPVRDGVGSSIANGALGGFAKGASIEMPRGIRINVVSPGLLDVSAAQYGHMFPGFAPISSAWVGLAYAKSVEGAMTGQVIPVD